MLVPIIRKNVSYNLRRISACITHRNKMKTMTAQRCNESSLTSVSLPNLTACRIYSTESEVVLPRLVDVPAYTPSILTPLKLLYLSVFKITPYIDKEFSGTEFLKGARYATLMISKALANKDFESLDNLVADDMIETLRTKIETLTPNQRQLIALNEGDIMFYVICDIAVTTGDEHSIQVTTVCYYIPGLEEKKHEMMSREKVGFSALEKVTLICNYTFTRKYVNNVGGPWIATLVNHFSIV